LVEASNKPPKKLYVTNHLTNTASKFPQNLLYIHYLGSSNDSSFLAYNKKVVKPNVSGEELEYELNTAAMEKLGFIIQRPLHSGIEAWDIIVPDKYVHLFNLTKFIELFKDCPYKKVETVGEKVSIDDDFAGIVDGENIKDIITLLEMSINDLSYTSETLIKLKLLNKQYYEKAAKQENE